MILVLSNANDATADFFQARLDEADVPYARLNTETLARSALSFAVSGSGRPGDDRSPDAAAGYVEIGGRRIALSTVSAVYYRRPVAPVLPASTPPGLADWMESEIRRAWGGVLAARPDVRWVNHPLAMSGASYKPEQLARARRIGLAVPATLITTVPAEAAAFCEANNWSVIAKPIGHGEIFGSTPEQDRVVYTNLVSREAAAHLDRVAECPTLLQQALPKDVDLRVTIVGSDVVAVALHSQERPVSVVDCRRDNMTGMRYSLVSLPPDVADGLRALVASYDLWYAAIDLVRDPSGRHWFLELNPAGQWAWLEQVAGAPISPALIRCLTQADV